jgi:hypothetical protein
MILPKKSVITRGTYKIRGMLLQVPLNEVRQSQSLGSSLAIIEDRVALQKAWRLPDWCLTELYPRKKLHI